MGEQEEIETMAASLKAAGLAASDKDALEKAKEMILGKNKGQSIAVSDSEKKEKVDEVIKEVDEEIKGQQKLNISVEESKPEDQAGSPIEGNKQQDISQFNKPDADMSEKQSFSEHDQEPEVLDITQSDMTVNQIAEAGGSDPVMTNDPNVLKQEKEAEEIQKVMTADEMENKGEEEKQSEETKEEEEGDVEEEEKQEEKQEELVDEKEEEEEEQKPQLTEAEKDMTDLTKLFNASK